MPPQSTSTFYRYGINAQKRKGVELTLLFRNEHYAIIVAEKGIVHLA